MIFPTFAKKTIVASKLHIDKLKSEFKNVNEFTTSEIIRFYNSIEPTIKRSTIDWRIYHLTHNNILHRLSRGRYSFITSNKQFYIPEIDRSMKKIYSEVESHLPFVNFIVWQTKWLNEFMRHQPGKFATVIEVERDVKKSVFHILQESERNVFLSPKKDIIENYLYSAKYPIIIQNLITEAPTQKVNNLQTATLEKILVDIISDTDLFSTFQGRELNNIYQTAFERYKISLSKMKRYAKRRSKMEKLKSILSRAKIRH